jgi:uncharacterized membrane protein
MTTVSVWTFPTAPGAEDALRTLERLQTRRRIAVEDAAVVVWPDDRRRPQTYQAGAADGGAALTGAFWGLVFGVLFLLPLVGVPDDAVPTAGLARVGLPDGFLGRVRDRIAPGTSALFLLTDVAALDGVREALDGRCSDVLRRDLAPEEEHGLRFAFDTDDEPGPVPVSRPGSGS